MQAGLMALGAKLTNIFSLQFLVIVGDSIRHLKYTQVWNDGMRLRGEPQIEPYSGESFVQVVYNLDFPASNTPNIPMKPSIFSHDTRLMSVSLARFPAPSTVLSFTSKTSKIMPCSSLERKPPRPPSCIENGLLERNSSPRKAFKFPPMRR